MTSDRPLARVPDDPQFLEWFVSPGEGDYVHAKTWSSVGDLDLDRRLTVLADMYLVADPQRQAEIRDFFGDDIQRLDELWIYARRIATLIEAGDDRWLRRGLAAIAIEEGRADARDSIVSLVLLRFAAERVGLDARRAFDDAIADATDQFATIARNARDHAVSDVEFTVREFGPPGWQDTE